MYYYLIKIRIDVVDSAFIVIIPLIVLYPVNMMMVILEMDGWIQAVILGIILFGGSWIYQRLKIGITGMQAIVSVSMQLSALVAVALLFKFLRA